MIIERILHPIATLKRKTYQEGFRDGEKRGWWNGK